jgi:hypothetical protein
MTVRRAIVVLALLTALPSLAVAQGPYATLAEALRGEGLTTMATLAALANVTLPEEPVSPVPLPGASTSTPILASKQTCLRHFSFQVTVLVPTDAAFQALLASNPALAGLAQQQDMVQLVLQYHGTLASGNCHPVTQ